MSNVMPYPAALTLVPGPQPHHGLGQVADDWAAIEVWLEAVADNSRSSTQQTIKTYRFHLAKLRWYCEHELGRPPSTWDAQDVKAFKQYLEKLPASSLRTPNDVPGTANCPPFLKQPGESSQADVLRFVKAMFTALHGTGYLRLNPMILVKSPKPRRLDKTRAVAGDLFELVLQVMDERPRASQKDHQLYLRDRFVFICLRDSGLRASELVGASMDAFRPLYDPKNGNTYWVLTVAGTTAKGGKERTVPVSPALLDALIAYRVAFGLDPLPETLVRGAVRPVHGLVLSVRTTKGATGAKIKSAPDRRFFGQWRDVRTRQGLHEIVKGRVRDGVELLEQAGDMAAAEHLAKVSSHWLRHTFALTAVMTGQDIRSLATALGHASVDTTMVYTEQDALDLIRSWEGERPGSVAVVAKTLGTDSKMRGTR